MQAQAVAWAIGAGSSVCAVTAQSCRALAGAGGGSGYDGGKGSEAQRHDRDGS